MNHNPGDFPPILELRTVDWAKCGFTDEQRKKAELIYLPSRGGHPFLLKCGFAPAMKFITDAELGELKKRALEIYAARIKRASFWKRWRNLMGWGWYGTPALAAGLIVGILEQMQRQYTGLRGFLLIAAPGLGAALVFTLFLLFFAEFVDRD